MESLGQKVNSLFREFDIIFALLLTIVATFVFQKLNAQLLALLFIAQLSLLVKHRKVQFNTTRYFWVLTALFALALLGLSYTNNVSRGLDIMGRQISFLIFPLFYCLYKVKRIQVLFKAYCINIFLLILLSEGDTIYRFFYKGDTFPLSLDLFLSYRYTGAELTSLLGIHNSYFGMYIVFANVLLLSFLQRNRNTVISLLLFLVVGIQSLFLLQMVAKIAIILNTILIPISIIYLLVKQRKLKLLLFSGILMASITFFSLSYLKLPLERITERYQELSLGEDASRETRIKLWNAALPVIENNIIFGVGTGDVEDKLHEAYEKNEILSKSNIHNQYLDYLMRYGILGLLVFLIVLGYAFAHAIKTKNYIYFCFTLIIMVSCFTENIFSRQWGITFYACFNYLLYLNAKQD